MKWTKRKMEKWKYRNNKRISWILFYSFHLLKYTSHLSLVILFQLCKICINIFEKGSMNICKNIARSWKWGVTFPALLLFTMFLPVCRQSLLSFSSFCYFYVARHVARTHDNSAFYRSTFKSSTRGWHVLNFCECYVGVSISSGSVFTRKPIINSSIIS